MEAEELAKAVNSSFFLVKPRPPLSTLFPYTTLFRSTCTAPALGATGTLSCKVGNLASGVKATVTMTVDRKSTRLNSSHGYISYAVFCLKKKNKNQTKYGTANRNYTVLTWVVTVLQFR